MPDPVEKTGDLVEEADRGRSARTPALAISGVTLALATLVAVVLAIAFTVYLLT
jgi:hypothetical protein